MLEDSSPDESSTMGEDLISMASTSARNGGSTALTGPRSSFRVARLNTSTFIVVEDDKYGEHPHIYVKIYPTVLLVTDTGCNSPRDSCTPHFSLRCFLELWRVPENGNKPLNPRGEKDYLILLTHCHYDHILGIPPFLQGQQLEHSSRGQVAIVASGHDPDFILEDLPKHSLCDRLGIETPVYTVTLWARHMEYLICPLVSLVQPTGVALRVQTLHTPGHTPDSLSYYDLDEHHLYVGDTFYARSNTIPSMAEGHQMTSQVSQDLLVEPSAAIIFPPEGNWIDYVESIAMLYSFVKHRNTQLRTNTVMGMNAVRVKVACGHVTADDDAEDLIFELIEFFEDIINGKVKPKYSDLHYGINFTFWEHQTDHGKFDVYAPTKLVQDVRRRRGTSIAST